MSDHPGGADALAAIHAAFSVSVDYTGTGLSEAGLAAVRTQGEAPVFAGDISVRERGYEIRRADLSRRPIDGDTVTDAGTDYRVIEVIDRDDVDAWVVMVEAA